MLAATTLTAEDDEGDTDVAMVARRRELIPRRRGSRCSGDGGWRRESGDAMNNGGGLAKKEGEDAFGSGVVADGVVALQWTVRDGTGDEDGCGKVETAERQLGFLWRRLC
ncbi:hypothetical protein LR48_Vigan04g092500 [Vigna angularis]|uniref:Uncharacterized protein n=1 Tax=Phaseolus angularis TaxID=3914 RepID=A0A0L9UDV8_PHAAN|nr:hypothetical protein LR48_Vigan04g092500 [Vigna angularis]